VYILNKSNSTTPVARHKEQQQGSGYFHPIESSSYGGFASKSISTAIY
jgi:hypothetical protein